MTQHFLRDLEHLKREILTVGSMVERGIDLATTALTGRRSDLAQRVISGDQEIDEMEVQIEEECLKVLALHQPVASDLRFVVTVIKVNSDLERMGDHAVHIAERALALSQAPALPSPPPLELMVRTVVQMVRTSLDAIVTFDTAAAARVCTEDDVVDDCLRQMFDHLEQVMREDSRTIARALHTLSACRNLERIADLATNVSEDLIFLAKGEIVRHRRIRA
jgi:phosphate transport system protein